MASIGRLLCTNRNVNYNSKKAIAIMIIAVSYCVAIAVTVAVIAVRHLGCITKSSVRIAAHADALTR